MPVAECGAEIGTVLAASRSLDAKRLQAVHALLTHRRTQNQTQQHEAENGEAAEAVAEHGLATSLIEITWSCRTQFF
jgi:hypothetical protein